MGAGRGSRRTLNAHPMECRPRSRHSGRVEDEGVLIPADHLQALSGLLGALTAVLRHYQPSDQLYDVLRTDIGAGGWGHLLSEGNPRGVWLLLEQATHLEGWLRAMAHGGFAEGRSPAIPPLPEAVAQSFAQWRRGIYEG